MDPFSVKSRSWFKQLSEDGDEDDRDDISCSSPVSSVGSHSDLEDFDQEETTSASPLHLSHVYVDPLHEMSSLRRSLPSIKGLSKHYKGKSQSFTSLSEVKTVEELSKTENPPAPMRRLKPCKSYALMPSDKQPPRSFCGALSSSNVKEGYGNRPSIPHPHQTRPREILG